MLDGWCQAHRTYLHLPWRWLFQHGQHAPACHTSSTTFWEASGAFLQNRANLWVYFWTRTRT